MDSIVPKRLFLTKGKGQHKEKLTSLEQALREGGIAPYNLVKISSIFPPGCRLISKQEAIPNDPSRYGYLSEHHSFGQDEREAGEYAEDLAADMLATTLGKKFDLSQIWNEEKSLYEIGDGMEVRTQHITQIARGKKGFWTTAFAAAVMVP
jgi:arginine decarboxylase